MDIQQSQSHLAKSYAELAAGVYKDSPESRYVVVTGPKDIEFIQMDKTSEADLLTRSDLQLKGELKDHLAPNAAPYVQPMSADNLRQLDAAVFGLEMFLGIACTQHIADDHPGGSSARAGLLGFRRP